MYVIHEGSVRNLLCLVNKQTMSWCVWNEKTNRFLYLFCVVFRWNNIFQV